MKTLFCILLLAGFGVEASRAADSPPPNNPAATNRDTELRRALERALAGETNPVAPTLGGATATNPPAVPLASNATVILPAAPVAEATNPVAVAPAPAASTSAPAVPPGLPSTTIPAPPVSVRPSSAPGTNAVPAAPPALAAPTAPTLPAAAAGLPATVAGAPGVRAPAGATNAAPAGEEYIPEDLINWVQADFNQVLEVYSRLVNRTIIRSPQLAGVPITLRTQTRLTRSEAITVLEKALALDNIALINIGEKFVVAVPGAQAGAEAAPWNTNSVERLPDMGQYMIRVVQLTNVRPSALVQILAPFSSARIPNPIMPIEDNQVLVLRDFTENVKRMLEIIKQLDIALPAEFKSEVIPIKYAKAGDISQALASLGGGGGGASIGTRAAAGGGARGGGLGRGGPGTLGTLNQPNIGTPGAAGTTPGAAPSPSGTFSSRLNAIIQRAASGAAGELNMFVGQTKIIADERTNSLLVFAYREDMEMIKEIIDKLDVVLAQVLIESVILDVTLSDNYNLGLSYLPQKPNSVGNYFNGIGALNNIGFLTPGVFSAVTNGASSLGSGFSYLGHFGQDLDVTLTALAANSAVKVIQRPSIMTFHATPASVFIGSTVPYVTGTYYGGGYAGGPASSYQPLQVGISVDVTPYINTEGLVVMTINETISELAGSTSISGVGNVPNTTQRTLSSEVAVRDRDTIVLGGFIRTSTDNEKSGMPILKDIPLIGTLFTSSSRTKARSELMVLMRPTVLKTPEIAAAETTNLKRRLPGVRTAEAESEAYEARRAQATEDELGTSKAPPAAKSADQNTGRDPQGFLPVGPVAPTPTQTGKP